MESTAVCYFKTKTVNENISWKAQFFGIVTQEYSSNLPRFFEIGSNDQNRKALLNENLLSEDEKEKPNILQENLGIEFHNEDGPAVIKSNGEKIFYQNGNLSVVVSETGMKEFFDQNANLSRVEYVNGEKGFYVNGIFCLYEYADGRIYITRNPFTLRYENGDKEFYQRGKCIRAEFSNGNESFCCKSYINNHLNYVYDRKNRRGKWIIENVTIWETILFIEIVLFLFVLSLRFFNIFLLII